MDNGSPSVGERDPPNVAAQSRRGRRVFRRVAPPGPVVGERVREPRRPRVPGPSRAAGGRGGALAPGRGTRHLLRPRTRRLRPVAGARPGRRRRDGAGRNRRRTRRRTGGRTPVVGYVHVLVHPAFHANGNVGWVEEVVVAPQFRGSGCGRLLLEAAGSGPAAPARCTWRSRPGGPVSSTVLWVSRSRPCTSRNPPETATGSRTSGRVDSRDRAGAQAGRPVSTGERSHDRRRPALARPHRRTGVRRGARARRAGAGGLRGVVVPAAADRARAVLAASTNLDNLAVHPLRVLLLSAVVVPSGPGLLVLGLLVPVLALAQRRLGRAATLGAFAVGHVVATGVVAGLLLAGLRLGWVDPSVRSAVDVGVSYGLACVAGLLVASGPRRWRRPGSSVRSPSPSSPWPSTRGSRPSATSSRWASGSSWPRWPRRLKGRALAPMGGHPSGARRNP